MWAAPGICAQMPTSRLENEMGNFYCAKAETGQWQQFTILSKSSLGSCKPQQETQRFKWEICQILPMFYCFQPCCLPFKYIFETGVKGLLGNMVTNRFGFDEMTVVRQSALVLWCSNFSFRCGQVNLWRSIIVSLNADNSSIHFTEILWVRNKVSKCFGTQT